MFTLGIITVVLAVLYGLVWNDQSAKQADRKKKP
jgi:hypothetical protein